MSKTQTIRFKCGCEGCNETVPYDAENQADKARLYDTYGNGKYRCVRHSEDEAAKAFAAWLNEGPKLAAAAGCHVGITVTGEKL